MFPPQLYFIRHLYCLCKMSKLLLLWLIRQIVALNVTTPSPVNIMQELLNQDLNVLMILGLPTSYIFDKYFGFFTHRCLLVRFEGSQEKPQLIIRNLFEPKETRNYYKSDQVTHLEDNKFKITGNIVNDKYQVNGFVPYQEIVQIHIGDGCVVFIGNGPDHLEGVLILNKIPRGKKPTLKESSSRE